MLALGVVMMPTTTRGGSSRRVHWETAVFVMLSCVALTSSVLWFPGNSVVGVGKVRSSQEPLPDISPSPTQAHSIPPFASIPTPPFPTKPSTTQYTGEPAPMGIVANGNDRSGNYVLNSSEFVSNMSWTNLNFNYTKGNAEFTNQLNLVLNFTRGGQTYNFWVQNVLFMNSTGHKDFGCGLNLNDILVTDEIWNMSSSSMNLPSTTLNGHGQIIRGGWSPYYSYLASSFPGVCSWINPKASGSFQMEVVSTEDEVFNSTYQTWSLVPGVVFEIMDAGTNGRFVPYDWVNFTFASGPSTDLGFYVAGAIHPVGSTGWAFDAENVIAGPGGGANTIGESGTSVTMSLSYLVAGNLRAVPSARNWGNDTAETVSGIYSNVTGGPIPSAAMVGGHGSGSLSLLYSRNGVGYLNMAPNNLAVVNLWMGKGNSPEYTAIDEYGHIWVTDSNQNTVKVVNGARDNLLANISVGSYPRGIAFDANSGDLYVANYVSNTISIINPTTYAVIKTLNLNSGWNPTGVVAANGYNVYVSDDGTNEVTLISGSTNSFVTNITVGNGPFGLAYDSTNGYVDVTNYFANTVSVIKVSTNSVIATVPVGTGPVGAATYNGDVFVTNYNSNNVTVFSDATFSVLANPWVGSEPWGIAYSPTYKEMFVSTYGGNSMRYLNISTFLVPLYFISTGWGPIGMVYDSADQQMYVADSVGNDLSIISGFTDSGHKDLSAGNSPFGVAYDNGNGDLYVTNWGSNSVTVYSVSTDTTLKTIAVGTHPRGVAYDSHNGYLYVANENSNNVTVINGGTNTIVKTLAGQNYPFGVAYDAHSYRVYVTNFEGNNVTVINGTAVVSGGSVPTGSGPYGIAYDSANHYMYVTNDMGNSLTIINDLNVTATLSAGSAPLAVTFDGGNGLIYVVDEGTSSVDVFDGSNHFVATILTGTNPWGIVYDSWNGRLYVANSGSNTLSVISDTTNTVTGSIPVGSAPIGMAFDLQNGEMFVADYGGATVSLVSGSNPLLNGYVAVKSYDTSYANFNADISLFNGTFHMWTNYSNGWIEDMGICTITAPSTLNLPGVPNVCTDPPFAPAGSILPGLASALDISACIVFSANSGICVQNGSNPTPSMLVTPPVQQGGLTSNDGFPPEPMAATTETS